MYISLRGSASNVLLKFELLYWHSVSRIDFLEVKLPQSYQVSQIAVHTPRMVRQLSVGSLLAVVITWFSAVRAVSEPGCQVTAPQQNALSSVRTTTLKVPNDPFGLVHSLQEDVAFVALNNTLGGPEHDYIPSKPASSDPTTRSIPGQLRIRPSCRDRSDLRWSLCIGVFRLGCSRD